MAVATIDAPTPEAPAFTRAPLGSVQANVHVNLGGFIAFDAAVRGAVVSNAGFELNHLCAHDDGTVSPVEQRFQCPACDRLGKSADFVKGSAKGDRYVVVPTDVLTTAETADSDHKGKLTLSVHRAADVNHALAAGSVYYLAPNVKGTTNEHYATLARVMHERVDLAFVGVMATRKVAYRYLVSSDGVTITLTQLADPDLVRERPNAGVDASPTTVKQLHQLLDVIVSDFDPYERVSQRSTAIETFLADAVGAPVAGKPEAPVTVSADLSASLQAALAAAGVTPIGEAKSKRSSKKKAS